MAMEIRSLTVCLGVKEKLSLKGHRERDLEVVDLYQDQIRLLDQFLPKTVTVTALCSMTHALRKTLQLQVRPV